MMVGLCTIDRRLLQQHLCYKPDSQFNNFMCIVIMLADNLPTVVRSTRVRCSPVWTLVRPQQLKS
jgi:hypothetical protein